MMNYLHNLFTITKFKRYIFFIVADLLISFFTLYFSYLLRFNFHVPSSYFESFFAIFCILTILKLCALTLFQVYNISWRYFSVEGLKRLVLAHLLAYVSFAIIFLIFKLDLSPFARAILIIDLFLSLYFIAALRISKRIMLSTNNQTGKITAIIGTAKDAESIARVLIENNDYHLVAFFDESQESIGASIHNIKVFDLKLLASIVKKKHIQTAIISENLSSVALNESFELCKKAGIVEIKQIDMLSDDTRFKNVSIEDLLARKPKDLDFSIIKNFVQNKVILITGAGGSIGSELCSLVMNFNVKQLIAIDHSEFNLYQLQDRLSSLTNSELVNYHLLSVLDKDALKAIFTRQKVDVVLHAAAYKHVHLVELNIFKQC